jgi:hypothetical protein
MAGRASLALLTLTLLAVGLRSADCTSLGYVCTAPISCPPRLSHPPDGFHHTFGLLAIFRGESSYFREWLEYHLLIGVEHFYLLSNDCEKDAYSSATLASYVEAGVVTLDRRYLCEQKFQRVALNSMFEELVAAKFAMW